MAVSSLLLIGLLVVIILMILTWLLSVKVENFGIVDATWSLSFLVQALFFFFLADGYEPRKWLLLITVGLWSFRLGYYLTKRIYSHHPHEDTRYIALREDYGQNYRFRFFIFFMLQAFSVSLLTFPLIFAFTYQNPEIHLLEYLGVAVWALALIGESIADKQLNSFKTNPLNRGKTCDVGLWKYSRHPNYFFESVIWWGYYLMLLGAGNIYWGIYSPLIILFILLKVTGVPPSEAQALKSRGDEYRRYQETTSVFVPWFPKK